MHTRTPDEELSGPPPLSTPARSSDPTSIFAPNDPQNPRNWARWRKWSIVLVILLVDLTVSWAASGFSPASTLFAAEFSASSEVATLGLSLYVLGLALGPMVLAPLSEYFGRRAVYIVSYGVFLAFLLGTALVRDLGGFLALRLISGLFSSVTIGMCHYGGLETASTASKDGWLIEVFSELWGDDR